jgi:hypothetical protein
MATRANRKPQQPQQIPAAALEAAPQTVQAAPQAAQVFQHPAVLVYDGGLNARVNVVSVPQVHPADLELAGSALKNLAFNLLAGNVDPALMDRDAKFWGNRTLKDHKTAFFGLIGTVKGANGKSAAQVMVDRWNAEVESKRNNPRARISQVTLTGLWKLFKPAREGGGGESPYGRIKAKLEALKRDILGIVESNASPKRKLEMIAEKCQPEEGDDSEK